MLQTAAQYHGSLYHPSNNTPVPLLRRVTDTVPCPLYYAPPTQRSAPDIQITGASSKNASRGVNKPYMRLHPIYAPQQQRSYSDDKTLTSLSSSRSSSRSSSLCSASCYGDNMNLPPLRTEPVGSRRGRPRSSISDDDDSMSAGELSDEEHGLPPVLSRFKLSRPQTPGSECSSVSHPSTQSPESIPALLPKEGRRVREPLAAPSPKPLTISPTASERRKVSRQSRRPPSPLLHDPVYSRALTKALQGSELVDITVPQLRTLIKKEPISPQREREWEVHAAYNLGGKETGKEYRCVYNEDKCKYAAKKQLTKRHIQGVHQGIKQYKCPFCPAAFHQETCAITHVSIHLGVFPFLCQFCGKRYNDVGRRFKHSKQEHGYQPKKTRRTPKSKKTQATEPSDSA